MLQRLYSRNGGAYRWLHGEIVGTGWREVRYLISISLANKQDEAVLRTLDFWGLPGLKEKLGTRASKTVLFPVCLGAGYTCSATECSAGPGDGDLWASVFCRGQFGGAAL